MKTEFLDKLDFDLEGDSKLLVAFEAAEFDDAASGAIECRFATPKARLVIDQIRARAT